MTKFAIPKSFKRCFINHGVPPENKIFPYDVFLSSVPSGRILTNFQCEDSMIGVRVLGGLGKNHLRVRFKFQVSREKA
jgi:hypothetical protein